MDRYSIFFSSFFLALAFFIALSGVSCKYEGWQSATATSAFNGQDLGGCGFENEEGYYGHTISLSHAISEEQICGACFEIKCSRKSPCFSKILKVTAAGSCNPSYNNQTRDWCMTPNNHIEFPIELFTSISKDIGAVVKVQYRRVKCVREGGIKFKLEGNGTRVGTMVFNVAGTGQVVDLKIKESDTEWIGMINSRDESWLIPVSMNLTGQSLSYRVKSVDGKILDSIDIVPRNWKFGQVYEGKQF